MEHQKEKNVDIFENFTWKIENFSHLNSKKIYSEPFVHGGYPWRIILFPKGNDEYKSLSIYLEAMQTANMSKGWSRDVKFKLFVFNQLSSNMTIIYGNEYHHYMFHSNNYTRGFMPRFLHSDALDDPNQGFIVKDACIVGAKVFLCESQHEKRVNQEASLTVSGTYRSQTGLTEVEVPRHEPEGQDPILETNSPVSPLVCVEPIKHTDVELFSPSIGELMDFSSVGKLEEICSQQSKTGCKFTDLAFAALGRVIYFLKTRKVRDVNDQSCKDLQVLWKELEKFRFDISWLEPQVQSALGIKSYAEKALEVEKLHNNVVALELENARLKAKLVVAEVNLNIERDLLQAKGFEERDLDSEL